MEQYKNLTWYSVLRTHLYVWI